MHVPQPGQEVTTARIACAASLRFSDLFLHLLRGKLCDVTDATFLWEESQCSVKYGMPFMDDTDVSTIYKILVNGTEKIILVFATVEKAEATSELCMILSVPPSTFFIQIRNCHTVICAIASNAMHCSQC